MSYIPTEHRPLIINSKFRLSGTSANFTCTISDNIDRIAAVYIAYVSIPTSFYPINANNNVLVLDAGATTVTISPGSYNAFTFASALQTELQVIDAGYTVTYQQLTGKITIANSGSSFVVNSTTSEPTSTMSTLLGFHADSASATSATADSVLDISGPQYINIKSSFFKRLIKYGASFNGTAIPNTICNIEIGRSFGDFIMYYGNTTMALQTSRSLRTTDVIDFSLVDQDGNGIDLNGVEWSMRLICITNQGLR